MSKVLSLTIICFDSSGGFWIDLLGGVVLNYFKINVFIIGMIVWKWSVC